MRDQKTGRFLAQSQRPSKEEIEGLYWGRRLSYSQIEKLTGLRRAQYWLEKYDIPRRPPSSWHKAKLSKKLLEELYLKQGMSPQEIAPRVNLTDDASVHYWLKKFGIDKNYDQIRRELHLKQLKPKLSKEALLFLYELQELTAKEIAQMTNCAPMHIRRCLDFYGIPRRGRSKLPRLSKKMGETKKQRWKSDEALRERVTAALMASRARRPNKAEEKLANIMQRNGLPFEYVGDGKMVISGLVPDFINMDGRKQIIELFGNYWHGRRTSRPSETEHGRGAIFKKYGYQTLVVWEHELDNESGLIDKIRVFMKELE